MRVLLVLLLAGCASASPTYGPDGKQAHTLNCSGLARSWSACFERAGEICKERGYTVLAKSDEQGLVATPHALGTTQARTMLIACK